MLLLAKTISKLSVFCGRKLAAGNTRINELCTRNICFSSLKSWGCFPTWGTAHIRDSYTREWGAGAWNGGRTNWPLQSLFCWVGYVTAGPAARVQRVRTSRSCGHLSAAQTDQGKIHACHLHACGHCPGRVADCAVGVSGAGELVAACVSVLTERCAVPTTEAACVWRWESHSLASPEEWNPTELKFLDHQLPNCF